MPAGVARLPPEKNDPATVSRRSAPSDLLRRVRDADHAALARALTLLERGGEPARSLGAALTSPPEAGYSIGLTGAPGAGKSSLTDRLISTVRSLDERVAVLAIDPSSPKTGGAILGDRVRMSTHATDPGVFIRSIATRGQLGGLAAVVPDAMRLMRCSGIPWLLVETVGVGQAELDIAGSADTTILVVYPGWGDGVQANKAGLLEVADILVVNKSDRSGADLAVRDLVGMLELAPPQGWTPPVVQTVATSGQGVDALWQAVLSHRAYLHDSGLLATRRAQRVRGEVRRHVTNRLAALADEWLHRESVAALFHDTADPHRLADLALRDILGTGDGTRPIGPENDCRGAD